MIHPSFLMALGTILGEIQRETGNKIIFAGAVIAFAGMVVLSYAKNGNDGLLKTGRGTLLFFAFFLAGYILYDCKLEEYSKCDNMKEGDVYHVKGQISDFEKKDSTIEIIINTHPYGRLLLRINDEYEGEVPDYDCIGDECEFVFEYVKFDEEYNYGNFNSNRYYRSLGIGGGGECISIATVKSSKNLYEILCYLKISMKNAIIECVGEEYGSVMAAMTIGEKSSMDTEIKEMYQYNGLSHITAISGLHVVTVGMAVYGILHIIVGIKGASVLSSIIMIMYCILTGGSISSIRAVIMFIFKMGGMATGRKYSPAISVSLSMVITLCINPVFLFNSSFIMSYMAVFAVLIVFPVAEFYIGEILKKSSSCFTKKQERIITGIGDSIILNLIMVPVICFYYYELPVYSVLINFFVIPLLPVVLLSGLFCSFVYMAVYPVWQYGALAFGTGIGTPGKVILSFFCKLCNFFERLPVNVYVSGKPKISEIVMYYIVLLFMYGVLFLGKRLRKQKRSLFHMKKSQKEILVKVMICILSIGFLRTFYGVLVNHHMTGSKLFISFLNVGQGDSIFIRDNKGITYLMDCGSSSVNSVGKYRASSHIKSLGTGKIDYVFVSHGDKDHISGIKEMLSEDYLIEIGNLVVSDIQSDDENIKELTALAENRGINIIYAQKGMVFSSGDFEMICVYPDESSNVSEGNDASLVFFCKYKEFSMLLTGDIGESAEKIVIENMEDLDIYYKGLDILKVPHHGSKYSSSESFLRGLEPLLSVISYGKNSYGHPSEEVLNRLENVNTKIYTTIDYGIMVKVEDDGKITDSTY